MKKNSIWIIVIIVVVVIAGAAYYYYMGNSGIYSQQSNQQNQIQAGNGPIVSVATSAELGNYLTAANGMTLYAFKNDTLGTSNCFDKCIANWPAYYVSENQKLTAGDGITGNLGTIKRTDSGVYQVTYNGLPVYFWINDKKPGDTTGNGFGGVWFVAKP